MWGRLEGDHFKFNKKRKILLARKTVVFFGGLVNVYQDISFGFKRIYFSSYNFRFLTSYRHIFSITCFVKENGQFCFLEYYFCIIHVNTIQ